MKKEFEENRKLRKKIEHIVLLPASWRADDYVKCEEQLLSLISQSNQTLLDTIEGEVEKLPTMCDGETYVKLSDIQSLLEVKDGNNRR